MASSSRQPQSIASLIDKFGKHYQEFGFKSIDEVDQISDILKECPHVKEIQTPFRITMIVQIINHHILQLWTIKEDWHSTMPKKLQHGLYACDDSFAKTIAAAYKQHELQDFDATKLNEVRKWNKEKGMTNPVYQNWVEVRANPVAVGIPLGFSENDEYRKDWVKIWRGEENRCRCVNCIEKYEDWAEKPNYEEEKLVMGLSKFV